MRIKEINRVFEVKTVFRNESEHIVRVTYICSVYDKSVRLSEEHTRAQWFRKEDIPTLQYKDEILRETLEKYYKEKQ